MIRQMLDGAGNVEDENIARQIANVGAIISPDPECEGSRFFLSGIPAAVTGRISYEEFLERVVAAGLSTDNFQQAHIAARDVLLYDQPGLTGHEPNG